MRLISAGSAHDAALFALFAAPFLPLESAHLFGARNEKR
jgi:hypothetical protein